jgi:hypothetical protein
MLHRTILVFALLATPAVVSSAAPVGPPNGGCLCPSGPAELLDQTDHIFIGDLIEVKGSGDEAGIAMIRVRENLKGALSGVVEVHDVLATRCSWSVFEMASPGRYVIFANLDEGDLVTPAFCPQTQPIIGWKDRLEPFRAYARGHQPATGKPASRPASTAVAAPAGSRPKTGS